MRLQPLFVAAFCMCVSAAHAADAGSDAVQLDMAWHVSLDADGHVTKLAAVDAQREKMPQIRATLDDQIRGWTFTPGKLAGQPAPTETTLHLSLGVTLEAGNHLRIRIAGARTGSRVAKYSIPQYPSYAIAKRERGVVPLRVDFNAEGKVIAAAPAENAPPVAQSLQRAAIDAVKKWRFQTERVAGRGVAGAAYVPICFDLPEPDPVVPANSCAWTPPGQHAALVQGQTLAMDPAATLATEVVGRTL